jgi:acetyl esterase/lipase
MRCGVLPFVSLAVFVFAKSYAQEVVSDLPYATPPATRQFLDVYRPTVGERLPVVFWIHGGGWQTGDKGSVQHKPKAITQRGFVFVSTNYRLLPEVEMETIVRDIAKSLRWVRDHIARYGGDPERIIVGGHSAGAQLAALVCIDHRYLEAEGISPVVLRGCIPVDGDTFDVPAIIETAETRRRVHGLPQAKIGHRQKFGNHPDKHRDLSAVTHVAKGKHIPPFLILHVAEHPDTTAQAQRLAAALQSADVNTTIHGTKDTTHSRINENLGLEEDATTQVLYRFLDQVLQAR